MKIENRCPVCGGESFAAYTAPIAPFISDRMFQNACQTECLLLHCIKCDFRFFNLRPEALEMSRQYDDYRGIRYQQQREKYELGYTREFNQLIGNNSIEVKNRGAFLKQVLDNNSVPSDVSVLDFGGNDGRFIPVQMTGEKYCYDISGNEIIAGVTKLSRQELTGRTFDLVLLAHVLEHVPYPKELMEEVISVMSPSSLLYIELPDEVSLPFFQSCKKALRNVLLGPKENAVMHEHINQFTVSSLRNLLGEMGLKAMTIGTKRIDLGWMEVNILYCLSKKSGSTVSSEKLRVHK